MYSSNESDLQKSQPPQNHYNYHSTEAIAPANIPGTWSTGLYDCSSDVPNCCLTLWCPCVTLGRIAGIVDKGSTSREACGALYAVLNVLGCACLHSRLYRSRLRKQYNLPATPCGDCLVHFFCEPCALCQEHRELKNRGFDMSLGWQENMDKQNAGVTMAPIVQGGMDR
ncbi:protein PLANT CADMIUM RESISTANCE 2 [Coffea arabica]|uniref:Protein PLANT CADMIUM RESISTANCE 2 n=1 Tax=Coffea arabica TaxID=13443 RepID=A0A6P6V5S6_COFAR|nr:protein PLANT CADMIUM RESISTANCE 2-like [Coffea arabica]